MIPPRSESANPGSSTTSRSGRKAITTAASKNPTTIAPQTHRYTESTLSAMSMGTAESAKSPTPVTKAAGRIATPEKYSRKNQRTSKRPGVENSTSVARSRTPGTVSNVSLKG